MPLQWTADTKHSKLKLQQINKVKVLIMVFGNWSRALLTGIIEKSSPHILRESELFYFCKKSAAFHSMHKIIVHHRGLIVELPLIKLKIQKFTASPQFEDIRLSVKLQEKKKTEWLLNYIYISMSWGRYFKANWILIMVKKHTVKMFYQLWKHLAATLAPWASDCGSFPLSFLWLTCQFLIYR